MFWHKKEYEYIDRIKELYKELEEKDKLILELLEHEKYLYLEICEKNTQILEWMKKGLELSRSTVNELNDEEQ